MTIELRVPISPTPSFCNQVLILAASLRRFHPESMVRVYVGHSSPTQEMRDLVEDSFWGQRIGFEWIGQREFDAWDGTRSPYLATMNRRFRVPTYGDHILIMDADTLVTRPLDDLIATDAVQGVMAHVAPMDDDSWRYLFAIAGCGEPLFAYPLSGGGIMGPEGKLTPWYANSGMIFAPRHLFDRLCGPYQEAVSVVRQSMRDTYWADQLCVALAVAKTGVPVRSLPPRYNFPNQEAFDRKLADEFCQIHVLHYLRTDIIDRVTAFESLTAMRRLINRSDLSGSNEVLRQAVARLIGDLQPPPLGSPGTEPPWA